MAAQAFHSTLALVIGMRRGLFIFIALLTALFFQGASGASAFSNARWTPEKGNTGYTYDGVGNRKSILYPQSSILYAYDGLNRLTNMVDALTNHNFSWTPASH